MAFDPAFRLKGAKSSTTAALRAAQGYGAALQTQTMTAISAAQRAVSQAVAQLPQPQSPAKSPAQVQTVVTPRSTTQTSTRAPSSFEVASRAVSKVATTIQQGAQQLAQAHAPIVQDIQRDVGAAVRSVGGAGAPRQAAPYPRVQATPAARSVGGAGAPLPAAPAPSLIPKLQAQHKYAVEQYGIDPELRQYEQRLAAYNAHLAAYGRGGDRGQGRQETAERLRNMQQSLEGQRASIMSRKKRELAGIRVLEANIQMMGPPS